MGNCLVTKLKATVSNPNLPILETMQQFTLDAITASGNASMTDVQKWALNHFFYQIGAIDNNGIFAKTKYLFIPMICNSVKAKVLVNYKTNEAFPVSEVESYLSFDENGCVYFDGSRKTQKLTTSENLDASDLFVAGGYPGAIEEKAYAAFRVTSPVTVSYGGANTFSVYRIAMNGRFVCFTRGADSINYGYVGNVYNNEYTGVLANASGIDDNPTEVTGTESIPTAPYTLNAQFSSGPVGISMIGSNLTTQEMNKLATAIKELMFSYCGL